MKEEIKQLKELQAKIIDTWRLLDIDEQIAEMHGLEKEMEESDFWNDPENAAKVGKKHEVFRSEIATWEGMKKTVEELIGLCHDLKDNPDDEMIEEVRHKISDLQKEFEKLEFFLLFNGKHDKENAIIAIHAGSGGTEAQDWAEMLLRMILRYSEDKGWVTTMIDESRGQEAGIKSVLVRVEGRYAYGYLKSEHGTHRLVRISPFDAEHMRHTSFALIEVLPEVEETEKIEIDSEDLRIDTYRSSGAGGQHVNKTDSAVRITHIPTNIVVQCQNERSQIQNKETAMKILRSKLQLLHEQKEEKERLKLRGEYKSPEWGSQIRSYVLQPYKMVKDIRTHHETADTDRVLSGDINDFVEAYLRWLKEKEKK